MSLPTGLLWLQDGGGATGEAALMMLHKQLICPICQEVFNKPVVILPCQHNLCRKCANELYQARTTMKNTGRFRCPSCRQEVVLDRHGVYGLQRNLLVENIIDVYKQEVSNNSSCASPSTPTPAPSGHLTCPIHVGEKMNIYCLTCGLLTCSLCKVFGGHQTCQVAPLTLVYQQQKDELTDHLTSLMELNHKIQSIITQLEDTCASIQENGELQKQEVCHRFQHVFSILEEKKRAMTQQISTEQEEKTGHTQALVRCYGDSVEANRKLLEQAASRMEELDIATFIQNSREVISKVRAASRCFPTETLEPDYSSLKHYRYNFIRQERALRSIDFLKVVKHVPEEQQPEEPKEDSLQNIQPQHVQETSAQNLDSAAEPVPGLKTHHQSLDSAAEPLPGLTSKHHQNLDSAAEPVPGLISNYCQNLDSAVEPVSLISPPEAPAVSTPDLEALGLLMDPVQPSGMDSDFLDGEPGQKNKQREEVLGGAPAHDPVKEGNTCDHQDGMSTKQAVTLLFYLLAFLLVLHRVWFYACCYICM